jgi:hypothetical protein
MVPPLSHGRQIRRRVLVALLWDRLLLHQGY